MNTTEARRAVVASVAVTAGLAAVSDIAEGSWPPARIAAAAVVTGVGLSMLAGPAPQLAGALALLLVVTTLTVSTKAVDRLAAALRK